MSHTRIPFNLRSAIIVAFMLLTSFALHAQKDYFDKYGKGVEEDAAYYYRQETDTHGFYRSYYISTGKPYFNGRISSASDHDENKNVYSGNCVWYYRTGNLKASRTYNAKGEEHGVSRHYYESGKIWKEYEFENGRIKNGTYTEYNEDGRQNRIFEEEFTNNINEWDLYTSDKGAATISGGQFELVSATKEGTSRYINYFIEGSEYTIEALINIAGVKENDKVGIIYGFKDWQNYHYFAISKKSIYIGSFYEGVRSVQIDGMYCSAISDLQGNSLKILSTSEKDYFSVNGEIQYKADNNRLYGNNVGFIASGNAKFRVDKLIIKQMNLSGRSAATVPLEDKDTRVTGSGIIFGSAGYILTNHHVIEHAGRLVVELGKVNYKAEVIIHDKDNDLAILKIKDENFTAIPLNYSFKESGQLDVGGSVFTIGYPHALSGMGKEAKFSDGKISSKTGYNGSINSFQTTIPVQPGNSGGPVFNDNGQLIGVINATFKEADNVSYAIKLNYIRNLIELLSEKIDLPSSNTLTTLSLEEKLKVLTNYVVLVKAK